jgi:hypothetical protein
MDAPLLEGLDHTATIIAKWADKKNRLGPDEFNLAMRMAEKTRVAMNELLGFQVTITLSTPELPPHREQSVGQVWRFHSNSSAYFVYLKDGLPERAKLESILLKR